MGSTIRVEIKNITILVILKSYVFKKNSIEISLNKKIEIKFKKLLTMITYFSVFFYIRSLDIP